MASPSILIVKLGAVGDCVHTLYALRALREHYPDARIGWVVETKTSAVVDGHPDLDEVIVFPRKQISMSIKAGQWSEARRRLAAFRRELRAKKYDVAIDFQNLFKSGLVTWFSGATTRIGFRKIREANFLFTNQRIDASNVSHAIEKYFALLAPLGVRGIPGGVGMKIRDEDKVVADEYFKAHSLAGVPVVAVNPGASWVNKMLPAAEYARAIDRLQDAGAKCVLIWGPGEESLVVDVTNDCETEPLVAPATNLKELSYFLSRCAAYLGNDSGPMHMAAMAGCAVVVPFGPSDPRRVGPWSDKGAPVTIDLPCRPCWRKTCFQPRRYCLEDISGELLAENVSKLLELS
ncbi:glycosyltransferase family 9 protein [bacterium]|nr:glycosyltransferase family 9 protein [bacterium]